MSKRLIIITLLLSLTIPIANAKSNWCYQETANVSTSCGGLNTGSYSTDTVPPGFVFGTFYFYSTYSKPADALSSSLWQVSHGGIGAQNVSIPSGCWAQPQLKFRISSHIQTIPIILASSQAFCWDGSNWVSVTSAVSSSAGGANVATTKDKLWDGDWTTGVNYWNNWQATDPANKAWNIYEEAMWWNMSAPADTCTPPSNGDWVIRCDDNCTFNDNIDVPADINASGQGVLVLNANWTFTSHNQYVRLSNGCELVINNSGGFK